MFKEELNDNKVTGFFQESYLGALQPNCIVGANPDLPRKSLNRGKGKMHLFSYQPIVELDAGKIKKYAVYS